jgi:hypothetical protein
LMTRSRSQSPNYNHIQAPLHQMDHRFSSALVMPMSPPTGKQGNKHEAAVASVANLPAELASLIFPGYRPSNGGHSVRSPPRFASVDPATGRVGTSNARAGPSIASASSGSFGSFGAATTPSVGFSAPQSHPWAMPEAAGMTGNFMGSPGSPSSSSGADAALGSGLRALSRVLGVGLCLP